MFETDETLIRRILQGKDREAGELLVERHYKRIYKEIRKNYIYLFNYLFISS